MEDGLAAEGKPCLLSCTGRADDLHRAWKIAQNVLEYMCGIATRAQDMVSAARRGRPDIAVAATRKNFPGAKLLSLAAATDGGCIVHRAGLSESLLFFDRHIAFLGGEDRLETFARLFLLRRLPEKRVICEADSVETALRFARTWSKRHCARQVQSRRPRPRGECPALRQSAPSRPGRGRHQCRQRGRHGRCGPRCARDQLDLFRQAPGHTRHHGNTLTAFGNRQSMMDFLHDSSFAQSVSRFAVVFIPAYLGIILHEVGHGWAALREGDPTAKFMGRLTINPLPHIDVLGLVVFIITSISGGFVFGWAKPVPIDPRNFRNPRRGLLTVSLAGPGTNIILAVLFACLLKILLLIDPSIVLMATPTETFVVRSLLAGVSINLCLAFFNLLPVPPLDGSKVLAYFLPARYAYSYLSIERYGFLILMLLIVTRVLDMVLGPLLNGSYGLLLRILDII